MTINLNTIMENPAKITGRKTVELPDGHICVLRDLFELDQKERTKVMSLMPFGKDKEENGVITYVNLIGEGEAVVRALMNQSDFAKLEKAIKDHDNKAGVYAGIVADWLGDDDEENGEEESQVGEA